MIQNVGKTIVVKIMDLVATTVEIISIEPIFVEFESHVSHFVENRRK